MGKKQRDLLEERLNLGDDIVDRKAELDPKILGRRALTEAVDAKHVAAPRKVLPPKISL